MVLTHATKAKKRSEKCVNRTNYLKERITIWRYFPNKWKSNPCWYFCLLPTYWTLSNRSTPKLFPSSARRGLFRLRFSLLTLHYNFPISSGNEAILGSSSKWRVLQHIRSSLRSDLPPPEMPKLQPIFIAHSSTY